MSSQATFESALKDHRLSLTRPRQAVFDALGQHTSLTMGELTRACPQFNRATMYRTVEVFEKTGIVNRIPHGWKHSFELGEDFHEHHHHATCDRCGASIALPENPILEKQLQQMAKTRDFTLMTHQIELHGLCVACMTVA